MRHTFAFVNVLNGTPALFDMAYVEGCPERVGVVTAVDGKIGGGTVWIKFHGTPYDQVLPFRFTQVCVVANVEKISEELCRRR